MARFPERFTTPRTLLGFRFCYMQDLLFIFFSAVGLLFEKKIAILCSQVTF